MLKSQMVDTDPGMPTMAIQIHRKRPAFLLRRDSSFTMLKLCKMAQADKECIKLTENHLVENKCSDSNKYKT